MVENKNEYIVFLIGTGLKNSTAMSYVHYLEAVSTHLNITISHSTISSENDVDSVIRQFANTHFSPRYKNNCSTALRQYFRFISEFHPKFLSPDEIEEPDRYVEGARKTITVNAYERDTAARRKCIEIHGLNCKICEMKFADVYGDVGVGYIHIHHIKPLSEIAESYVVNPETDLIPVCPNCHSMLHRANDGLTVESLRSTYLARKNARQ